MSVKKQQRSDSMKFATVTADIRRGYSPPAYYKSSEMKTGQYLGTITIDFRTDKVFLNDGEAKDATKTSYVTGTLATLRRNIAELFNAYNDDITVSNLKVTR